MPVPATYARAKDPKRLGFCHRWLTFTLSPSEPIWTSHLPSYLLCSLGLGAHSTFTLISCLIFYLGALFTIKTYIQLWNKPAFAPHSSELICTRLNPLNCLHWLSQTRPPCLASFAFVLVSLLVPLVHPRILSESRVALEERSCWLRHYLFGTNRIPNPTLTDWPLPTNRPFGQCSAKSWNHLGALISPSPLLFSALLLSQVVTNNSLCIRY